MSAQVRYALRPISAEEYDAAVEATPHLCPLAAMGDLRTGRELLAQAARDLAAGTFRAAEGAACGSQALLRRFLAARVAELQSQLRPCPALHRAGMYSAKAKIEASEPTDGFDGGAAPSPARRESDGPAEDGIPPPATDIGTRKDDYLEREWWARGPLLAFLTFGQRRGGLAALFDALPLVTADRLRRALDAADAADARRAADCAAVAAALDTGGGSAAAGSEGWGGAGPLSDPAELWEAEAEWGYATASFDPATGRPRPGSVRVNGRQASRRRRRRCARRHGNRA